MIDRNKMGEDGSNKMVDFVNIECIKTICLSSIKTHALLASFDIASPKIRMNSKHYVMHAWQTQMFL